MISIFKVYRSLRSNWKKTLLATVSAAYGIKYIKARFADNDLRREYCELVTKFGHERISFAEKPRRAMVFLNPAANEGNGRKTFEKNAAPILNLSGLDINLVKTEYEGQAKEFMSALEIKDTDIIVVAGGDGLLSEVIAGIMKKNNRDFEQRIPIAVIPVGKENRFFRSFRGQWASSVKTLCEAALTVIQGIPTPIDVMQIMGADGKETYAISGLQFGAYRDAEARKAKYWYFGPLKSRWTHLRTLMKHWPPTDEAFLSYITADDAERVRAEVDAETSNHDESSQQRKSWSWKNFFYRKSQIDSTKESPAFKEDIEVGDEWMKERVVTTTEFTVTPSSVNNTPNEMVSSCIDISLGPSTLSRSDYFNEAIRRIKSSSPEYGSPNHEHMLVERVKLIPKLPEQHSRWYSIDGEQYEAKPISIRLLRKRLLFLT